MKAGAPALVMAVVAALLAIYNSVSAWIGFGTSGVKAGRTAGLKVTSMTPPQVRAIARFLVFSVLAVSFSYMLAVIIDTEVRTLVANPSAVIPIRNVADSLSVVPWPPAAVWTVTVEVIGIGLLAIGYMAGLQGLSNLVTGLGGVVWVVAWLVGILTVLEAIGGLLMDLFSANHSDAPPWQYVVTVAVTGLLALVLAKLLAKLDDASALAFGLAPRSTL